MTIHDPVSESSLFPPHFLPLFQLVNTNKHKGNHREKTPPENFQFLLSLNSAILTPKNPKIKSEKNPTMKTEQMGF